MNVSKSMLLNIALITIFVTSMFLMTTKSAGNSKTAEDYTPGQYSAWLDVNDDGIIEMMDFFH